MCGIAGIISNQLAIDPSHLIAMRDKMLHRGPDDEGLYISNDKCVGLAHRRLSIIDLTENGRQPMVNHDGTIWISYNGEIYNFKDLKNKLISLGYVFKSKTDTEVLLHAYEAWGDDCLQYLHGMFAFAIWDDNRKRLLLARDRIGIKPLFYYWDGKSLSFASEIKGLLALPRVKKELNITALFDYLTCLYIPAPKTIYQNMFKLQPGHYLVFQDNEINEKKYWDVEFQNNLEFGEKETLELLHEKINDAVGSHLISDVPLGVLLSGGLDSSAVTSFANKYYKNGTLQTCSVGFDVGDHSETEYARIVAKYFNTDHYEATVGYESMRSSLANVLWMYDEPYADSSAIPTYEVCRLARKKVKVALSGDGGDEVFAGYTRYPKWLKRSSLTKLPVFPRNFLFSQLTKVWPEYKKGYHLIQDLAARDPLQQYYHYIYGFSPKQKRNLLSRDLIEEFIDYDEYWMFSKHSKQGLDPLTQIQYIDLKTYLPDDILTKVDRASMANSLEIRPPLLDHRLVEFVLNLPSKMRYQNGEKKLLFKRAMANHLPKEIIYRKKKGFSVPWKSWEKELDPWINDRLVHGKCVEQNILNPKGLKNSILHLSGLQKWALLVLEEWQRDNCIN